MNFINLDRLTDSGGEYLRAISRLAGILRRGPALALRVS
jgi:hypothetical protein